MSNLTDNDVRELAWVADVLEHGADDGGNLSVHELNDLAEVIRAKLPARTCERGTYGCSINHTASSPCETL